MSKYKNEDTDENADLLSNDQTRLEQRITIVGSEFTKMADDLDSDPMKRIRLPDNEALANQILRQNQYDELLRRAKTEDLSEISGIGCLYQCGEDNLGRPVIVFIGKWFRFDQINLDKALLYLVYLLDSIVDRDYVIMYFHTMTTAENHASVAWIKQVYSCLEYKYKKNLKAFYIVHPTFWTKLMTWWFTTFMSTGMKEKVHSLSGVEYLYSVIDPKQLEVPAFIIEHDMTVNGIRYVNANAGL